MLRGLYTGKILAPNFNLMYHNGAPVEGILKQNIFDTSKSVFAILSIESGLVLTVFSILIKGLAFTVILCSSSFMHMQCETLMPSDEDIAEDNCA